LEKQALAKSAGSIPSLLGATNPELFFGITMFTTLLMLLIVCLEKPHLVIISAEDEYQTEKTLPVFAEKHLSEYRVSVVLADPKNKNHLPEIQKLETADVAILSVRRRPLVEADLKVIRKYVEAKKPLVAIRTSSHAFAPKAGEKLPEGVAAWLTFDQDVLGCKYTGHYSNKIKTTLTRPASANAHAALKDIGRDPFNSPSWLYKSGQLADNCTLLLTGTAAENPPEPAAWVRTAGEKHGRVFYTCLGHAGDFELKEFQTLLKNGVNWVREK
jgi:hypothetical protein